MDPSPAPTAAPSFLEPAPSGIVNDIAAGLARAQQPAAGEHEATDWSGVPRTVSSIPPNICDPAAAALLPPEDPGVGLGFTERHIVVAYQTQPTQLEMSLSSRRSGWEVRPVIVTEGHAELAAWAAGHQPIPLRLEDVVALLTEGTTRGSDIHITVGQRPWLRDGGQFAPRAEHRLVSEVDMLHMLDEAQPGFDLDDFDGDLDFSFSAGGERWRANLAWERGHLYLALRVIPTEIPNATDLGVPGKFMTLTTKRAGLVIVAGPTGSGKSTTLAAFLDTINQRRDEHILTIEKPIEFVHPNKKCLVTQREIGLDTITLGRAFNSAMREDPDVVLVGEARDYEEIKTAISMAETGHLVLMTLHARSAEGVVDRIIDSFPSAQQNQVRTQLAGVLQGVMIQTLVPDAADPTRRHLGYELMILNDAIRSMISAGDSRKVAAELLSSTDQVPMEETLARLVVAGKVSQTVAENSCDDRRYLAERIKYHRNNQGVPTP